MSDDGGAIVADGGPILVDGGIVDGGAITADAGASAVDAGAGVLDAGASPVDAGATPPDAGLPSTDGGAVADAGAQVPQVELVARVWQEIAGPDGSASPTWDVKPGDAIVLFLVEPHDVVFGTYPTLSGAITTAILSQDDAAVVSIGVGVQVRGYVIGWEGAADTLQVQVSLPDGASASSATWIASTYRGGAADPLPIDQFNLAEGVVTRFISGGVPLDVNDRIVACIVTRADFATVSANAGLATFTRADGLDIHLVDRDIEPFDSPAGAYLFSLTGGNASAGVAHVVRTGAN